MNTYTINSSTLISLLSQVLSAGTTATGAVAGDDVRLPSESTDFARRVAGDDERGEDDITGINQFSSARRVAGDDERGEDDVCLLISGESTNSVLREGLLAMTSVVRMMFV
jgi:hypothetical protein